MNYRDRNFGCFARETFIGLPACRHPGQQQNVRVVRTVRDESNAIALPGMPVEVVGTGQTVYTDVDGRYIVELPAGDHQLKVALDGYQERLVSITTTGERTPTWTSASSWPLRRDGHRDGPAARRGNLLGRGAAGRSAQRR